tara:strand:+ start:14544 stop:16241 length:1698 start_codon:yes stop_codon:yes gene_type:complete
MQKEIENLILKFALQNAVKFNGRANPGAIVGKLLGDKPELKSQMKEIGKEISRIVKHVNLMKRESQVAKLKEIDPSLLEKKKKVSKRQAGLQELQGAEDGKVNTRIPPEPSKYNHLGHALAFLINYLYAKKYNSKCVLRFDDTNPNKCKQEYVDAMMKDVIEYLGIKPDSQFFASDKMKEFYKYAEKLVKEGNAYVCFCEQQKMRENRRAGIECECRNKDVETNLTQWKNMLNKKYEEGECCLRIKGDMESLNHVMRDFVICRITLAPHYKHGHKYHVWPNYDFESAIAEHLTGTTYILRPTEFGLMRIELQDYIKDKLGISKQKEIQFGRFVVKDAPTQGRVIRELIESGKMKGWDDPRLVTLRALKRRGFVKEMFYDLVKEVGLSKSNTNIDWTLLSSINRKYLDPICKRFFFMSHPKLITIKNAPKREIKLKFHPDDKIGGRDFSVSEEFYIEEKDYKKFKEGGFYRLMDCLNFKFVNGECVFDSLDHEHYKEKGSMIMHWLPKHGNVDVEIMMDDANVLSGLGEHNMKVLKVDDIIQAQRFGFIRLDEITDEKMKFWFTHK